MRRLETKRLAASHLERALSATSVDPDATAAQFAALGSSPLSQKVKALSLVSRPELSLHDVLSLTPELEPFLNEEEEIRTSMEIRIKYAGYIEKEQQLAERLGKLQDIRIPRDYPYSSLTALSIEARQKLSAEQPETLAHASTISGVSPADVAVLLVHFGR